MAEIQQETSFSEHFGRAPEAEILAPGRVNLIGEHTDYNAGLVLPMAIDRGTRLQYRRREDGQVRLWSSNFQEEVALDLEREPPEELPEWASYVTATVSALRESRRVLRGWEGSVASDLPVGGGLSSSASFLLAVAKAFLSAIDEEIALRDLALLCHRAETQYIGVRCGVMDHLACAEGLDGHALLIDCRTLETSPVCLPREGAVLVLDTARPRQLAASAYNTRREECERAATELVTESLRELGLADLSRLDQLAEPLDRRVRHVISENDRVLQMVAALGSGDLQRAGALMNESHESLRADYEVSCAELDTITELARALPACFGARMTGAGFGGCAVALVQSNISPADIDSLLKRYAEKTSLQPRAWLCHPSDGVRIERLT